MRVLVLSDSHGDIFSCKVAIEGHPEAEFIIHLGDGEEDLDELKRLLGSRRLLRVRGNGAYSAVYGCPAMLCCGIGGRRLYLCHGHKEGVKSGLFGLKKAAENCGADIALYGHTHIQHMEQYGNVFIMNPGSIRQGEYGLLDISEEKIEGSLEKL